jgi:hypothetical protein
MNQLVKNQWGRKLNLLNHYQCFQALAVGYHASRFWFCDKFGQRLSARMQGAVTT